MKKKFAISKKVRTFAAELITIKNYCKMAKYFNNKVKTGRLAGSVFAVRYGETIERAYQPIVANPNTPAQVGARAVLKMMSQLSAVFAPVIAMRRNGAVSPRNMFIKVNSKMASYANDEATVNLLGLKLTQSVVSLPNVSATRADGKNLVSIDPNDGLDVSRIVYVEMIKQADKTLRLGGSMIIETPGANNRYGAEFAEETRECVYYAYGIRDNNEAARVAFSNLEVNSAETVAKLITNRSLLETDVTLTETKTFMLAAQP